jgi:hypothetical protein
VTGKATLAESFLFVHRACRKAHAKPIEQAHFRHARAFDLS